MSLRWGSGASSAARRLGLALAVLCVVAWLGEGVRTLDPISEFGVRRGPGGAVSVVTSRRALAPAGLYRWSRWPRGPVEVRLPGAAQAMLPSADGSRYGLKGSAVLRALPERARELAATAGGFDALVLDAVRAAAPVLAAAEPGERAVPTLTRAFEARLRDEIGARGADVSTLRLEGYEYLTAERETAPIPPEARVLLIGLDGADWDVVDPLMAAGRMPNLERLVRHGVRAKFLSITPMLSPVIWTSIATGVEPARHGIMDFLVPAAGGASEPVTSKSRTVPTVWEMLSAAGARVGVTGWWATWPADPVDGYLVTDRVAYQLFGYAADARSAAGKTWPPSLYERVRPLIVSPDDVPWSDLQPYLDGARRSREAFDADERTLLDEFRTLLASGRTYLNVALAMRREGTPRFEAVYFEGTDTVGHLFMPYRPPRLPSVDDRRFAAFHAVVDRYYQTADEMLGRLLEDRGDWIVIVCSDHGFASDATRPLTTDSRIGHGAAADWHRRFGMFVMSGPGVRQGTRLEEVSVYDIAPTILAIFGQPVPRSWPGRVLGPALEPERLAAHPVTFRVSDPQRIGAEGEDVVDDSAEAQELREKLAALGYLSATGRAPMTTKNNRGVAFLAEGKFDEAAAAFREAIADQPDQPTLWVNLGIALRYAGRPAEARTWFVKACARPESQRAGGLQLAQLDLEAGDLAAAERGLRSVLSREPGAAEVRNSLGLVLERRGRIDEARKEYEEAARLDPNAAEPRNNLGNLARQGRRFDDAEAWYTSAIEADPYFMGAYNNLALVYQDQGHLDRAIELYGRALGKAPKNAIVLNNLASLYFAAGDHAAARETWNRATQADPRYASPLNNLAGLALAEGDDRAASEFLDRALALDPNYGDARINRALIARRRGDTPSARAELLEAAKDPRAAGTARMQLGFLELEAGHPGLAVSALDDARQRLGDRTDILNALGEAHARLGNRGAALQAWRLSLQLDAKQTRLRSALAELEKQE